MLSARTSNFTGQDEPSETGAVHSRATSNCPWRGSRNQSHPHKPRISTSQISRAKAKRGFHQAGPSQTSPTSNARKNRGANAAGQRLSFTVGSTGNVDTSATDMLDAWVINDVRVLIWTDSDV